MNEKFIQYKGPFRVGDTISFTACIRCGIQAPVGTIVTVTSNANSESNSEDFEIGKTGILEFYNCAITSVYFKSFKIQPYEIDEDNNYTYEDLQDSTDSSIPIYGIIDCTIQT